MGNILSSLFGWSFGKANMRILILGLDGAGKTTILYKLKLGGNISTIPTIGCNVETIEHMNTNLTIFDVSSQEKIRPLWRYYFADTQGLIFVIDSNDRERIGIVRDELRNVMNDDELRKVCLLIFANKQDLPDSMNTKEITEVLKLHSLRHHWFIQGTCATSGIGLCEGLNWLVRQLGSVDK